MNCFVQSVGAAGAGAADQGRPPAISAEGDQVDGVALEQRAEWDLG